MSQNERMSGPAPSPWVQPGPSVPEPHRAGFLPGCRRVWTGGIVVMLIGTFLPWLRSGRISRNSYELAGVGARRLQAADWVEAPLRAWPFLGLLWAVALVLMILGRPRIAGWLAAVLAGLTGLVALGGLFLVVRLDSVMLSGLLIGPLLTAAGAAVVLIASVAILRKNSPSGAAKHPPDSVG